MEVKIIKANTPTELSSKRKIERLRVAAYCRVSTDDEDQTKSYQSMIKYYTDLIHNNKQWVFAGIFADKAITGTKADIREEFQRLIQECLSSNCKKYSKICKKYIRYFKICKNVKGKKCCGIF